MTTTARQLALDRRDGSPISVGALLPLSRPGWLERGRHLLAGLEQGARRGQ